MHLLILVFALQTLPGASRATSADSAITRAALLKGLAAFDSVADIDLHLAARRYLEQLQLWGLKEEGGEAALRFDRAMMRLYKTGSTFYASWWLSLLLDSNDTLAADRFIEKTPAVTREGLLAEVARGLAWAKPELSARLEARISAPWHRAEMLHFRALNIFAGDSARARRLLSEAITISRSDSTAMWTTWRWMIELLRIGGQVALDDIVQAAVPHEGDLWNARIAVASTLIETGMRSLTSALVDSLLAGIAQQEASRQPYSRIQLLQLRGTSRDSALASDLRDSLDAASITTEVLQQRQLYREHTALYGSVSPLNPDSLRATLSRPISDLKVAEFLEYLRTVSPMQENTPYRPFAGDSMRAYAQIAVDMMSEMIRARPAMVRDSLQVNLAAIMAYIDVARGLSFAKSIATKRFRDRAVSAAISRLVKVDADAAEREAASLEDSSASATAWSVLAQAAVAGGRLSAAASLAPRATGEPLVRALFALATAQYQNGLRDDARRTITSAFEQVDVEFRCDGCIVVKVPQGARAPRKGTEPQLLSEVVSLTTQLGMRDYLLVWAARQQGDSRIANAHLLVVEALSRQLLRWTPPLQLHFGRDG